MVTALAAKGIDHISRARVDVPIVTGRRLWKKPVGDVNLDWLRPRRVGNRAVLGRDTVCGAVVSAALRAARHTLTLCRPTDTLPPMTHIASEGVLTVIPNRDMVRAMGRFLQNRVLGRRVPLAVYWKVTWRCNSACLYCGVREHPDVELGTEALQNLMTQAKWAGTYRINLSGGEPLVRDDFGVLVRHLKGLGVSVGVDTNGRLVPDRLEDLRIVDGVAISLDGAKATHDAQRGAGSYDKAVSAADLLASAGVPITYNCVITGNNFDQLQSVLNIAAAHDAATLFQPATPWRHDSELPNPLAPSREQLRLAIDFLSSRRRHERKIGNPRIYFRTLRDYPNQRRLPCPGGRIACVVNPDGMVGNCDFGVPEDQWRDATTLGFEAAFNTLTQPAPCDQCSCANVVTVQHAMRLHPEAIWNLLRTV